jgi:hypothetical protein
MRLAKLANPVVRTFVNRVNLDLPEAKDRISRIIGRGFYRGADG